MSYIFLWHDAILGMRDMLYVTPYRVTFGSALWLLLAWRLFAKRMVKTIMLMCAWFWSGITVICIAYRLQISVTLHWRHNDHGWCLKSPASRLITQSFIQTQIKENIKALRHWSLCGEFTGPGEFPAQRASNAEYGPIWWRYHDSRLPIDVGIQKPISLHELL